MGDQPVDKVDAARKRILGLLSRVPTLVKAIAALIAAVLVILGAAAGSLRLVTDQEDTIYGGDTVLRIVDILPEGFSESVTVELKIRNAGGSVAFLKEAEFLFSDVQANPLCAYPTAVPVSATYDVELPSAMPASAVSTKISQSIGPNEVERFVLRVGTSFDDPGGWVLYRFRIRLYYNEGRENYVDTSPIILAVPAPWDIGGLFSPGGDDERGVPCWKRRIDSTLPILEQDGIRHPDLETLEKDLKRLQEEIEDAEGTE